MKYKYRAKDKVRITENASYGPDTIEMLEDCNYIMTIKKAQIHMDYPAYTMEEDSFDWIWPEHLVIEALYEDPIDNRFEILDL